MQSSAVCVVKPPVVKPRTVPSRHFPWAMPPATKSVSKVDQSSKAVSVMSSCMLLSRIVDPVQSLSPGFP